MHISILFRLSTDLDDATFELDSLAGLPVTVVGLGSVVEDLLAADISVPTTLEWGRAGWSAPWFPMLPEAEIDRQLAREASALSTLGVDPGPLIVTGPWAPWLPPALARNSIPALALPDDVVGRLGSGVVAHLDAVMSCVAVTSRERLDEALGDPAMFDDLLVVECETTGEAQGVAQQAMATVGCDLNTIGNFFSTHRPRGRIQPEYQEWEAAFDSRELQIHHRKLVRLMTRIPDRISNETERAVLLAESGEAFAGRASVPHEALVEARRAIDDDRRRGQEWGKVTRLDWNADGRDEVHVELPDFSFVVVPHDSASVPTLDLKRPIWPASALPLEPGWDLIRFITDLDDLQPLGIDFEVESVVETKTGDVTMTMDGEVGAGRLRCVFEAGNGTLRLTYILSDVTPGWVGPELRMTLSDPRTRTDGSPWQDLDGPTVASGHRIRIQDEHHRVSIESLSPISCFLRSTVGGVVAWPHWATGTDGTFRLTVALA